MTDPASLTTETIRILRDLVAFETVSRTSNLTLIEYIETHLSKLHIPTTRVLSDDGARANLLARIGPERPGGIVLSGHTDVVPVEGQHWSTPPYALTEKGGLLYGRGSSDMKGFCAAMLAFAPVFVRADLKVPVYLSFTYDEEIGCLGAPRLVEYIAKQKLAPALAIIGEPTGMQVVTAHKGVHSFETVVTGVEAHSSEPARGVNAVHAAAKLVAFLSTMADEQMAKGLQDARFDPPHSTVHVGVLEGGTARNIIPAHARFLWEIRPLPGDDADAMSARFEAYAATMRQEMQARFPQSDIRTTPLSRMHGVQLPSPELHSELPLYCAQANAIHAVSFGTEAGVFADHHIPVVVCGPGHIAQAHKPDEFIAIEQLEKCVRFLLRLRERLTA